MCCQNSAKSKKSRVAFTPPCHERCRETVALNVIIWLSEPSFRDRKSLKNKDILSSGSYSHSSKPNAFCIIFVRCRPDGCSESLWPSYSTTSTASGYHFVIRVITGWLATVADFVIPRGYYTAKNEV